MSRPTQSLIRLDAALLEATQQDLSKGATEVIARVVGPTDRLSPFVEIGMVTVGTGFVGGLTGPRAVN